MQQQQKLIDDNEKKTIGAIPLQNKQVLFQDIMCEIYKMYRVKNVSAQCPSIIILRTAVQSSSILASILYGILSQKYQKIIQGLKDESYITEQKGAKLYILYREYASTF